VTVLPPPKQARSAEIERRPGASAAHEQLVAHHEAAGQESEIGNTRICADGRAESRKMQRRIALRVDLDAAKPRAVADHKIEGGVDLVVDAVRSFMAFKQGHARPRPDRDEGTRKHGRGALRAVDEDEMQRPRSLNPCCDLYDGAVAHKGGVKFVGHIAFGWACGSEAFRQL